MSNLDKQERKEEAKDLNRDPISGAPGSHPVGVGVGGIAGGAAAGALAGTVFGPLGTLIGAAAGVLAGAAAGKGVAERLDPTVETEYWRQEHQNRPYYKEGTDYDRDYATVYGFGLQARETRPTSTWEETEATLAGEWRRNRGESRLEWDQARLAARDAWDRADRTHTVYLDNDTHYEGRFDSASYRDADYSYDDYRPAYRYGMQARQQHAGRQWDDHLERDLGDGWDRFKANSRLSWEKAKHAVREAFDSEQHDAAAHRNPTDPRV
ncbi:hypothetical protein [Xanthomonas nasturtii]|uniref:hypothetical protein n=1 Tax=Xanthomonas nasturtii TaxID=1843581 RepID=UPI0020132E25|nr:hypothetical protein [Xanthomonas nasturtii]MCL1527181.1 hypothetical protein [Xanthomonas nasturtii]MCL1535021.1 hypothetical protein [Xanthomonas nasturtii]MCL1544508.1 hypothetical protein [Xanthomonas nasturtii]